MDRRWPQSGRDVLLLLCVVLMLVGCRAGSRPPRGWEEVKAPVDIESATRDLEPRLQVVVHYDKVRSTHVMIRVTSMQQLPVVWDPGGAYGLTRPAYGRQSDVVLAQPPDLRTWWQYRARWLREPFMLVFEWDIDAGLADVLQEILRLGAAEGTDATVFRTVRRPGFCNYAACSFLRRFATPPMSPGLRSTFMPDGLAQQLWHEKPDRVLRYSDSPDHPPSSWQPSIPNSSSVIDPLRKHPARPRP